MNFQFNQSGILTFACRWKRLHWVSRLWKCWKQSVAVARKRMNNERASIDKYRMDRSDGKRAMFYCGWLGKNIKLIIPLRQGSQTLWLIITFFDVGPFRVLLMSESVSRLAANVNYWNKVEWTSSCWNQTFLPIHRLKNLGKSIQLEKRSKMSEIIHRNAMRAESWTKMFAIS